MVTNAARVIREIRKYDDKNPASPGFFIVTAFSVGLSEKSTVYENERP
jgi:hypothetical protein